MEGEVGRAQLNSERERKPSIGACGITCCPGNHGSRRTANHNMRSNLSCFANSAAALQMCSHRAGHLPHADSVGSIRLVAFKRDGNVAVCSLKRTRQSLDACSRHPLVLIRIMRTTPLAKQPNNISIAAVPLVLHHSQAMASNVFHQPK
jgi:hypothetical protein